MADMPLQAQFNSANPGAAVIAGDPDFWRLYAEWRRRETIVNSSPAGTDDELDAEVAWADDALLPMMSCAAATIAALEAKLKAIREMDLGSAERGLPDGRSFWQAIMDDCARLAKVEADAHLA